MSQTPVPAPFRLKGPALGSASISSVFASVIMKPELLPMLPEAIIISKKSSWLSTQITALKPSEDTVVVLFIVELSIIISPAATSHIPIFSSPKVSSAAK